MRFEVMKPRIMVKEDYKAKALQQLSDAETYAAVTTDPTPKQTRAIQKTLDRLVREETLPAHTARKLSPKETSIARAHGLLRPTKWVTL